MHLLDTDRNLCPLAGICIPADMMILNSWVAYEGVGAEVENAGVEEQGCIQVELNPEIILAIQEGTALLAVVSK